MIRVLLADDHAVMRECLLHILMDAQTFLVAGQAADGASTLALVRSTPADVLVLDLTMPAGGGIALIERIRAIRPQLRVLVLSMHTEPHVMERAFKAGAAGYLTKECAGADLVDAIRKVAQGELYAGLGAAERQPRRLASLTKPRPHEALTSREREVLEHLAAGESSRRIADALDLTPQTISTHKKNILEKLELANDAALVRYALRHGFGCEPGKH
ncbi:MAG TPA: response regulator transcription factor [Trinickia sp.]|uniref:response regulator transcription factor n=1 Tax=Trinickia sp. TaxID=2571163 RepID=UPI002C5AB28F|nr:response regulator transcription factor [Trinickia sp.]HVW49276.1 response regulator transcription factor [Trinickia sp.]